MCLCLSYAPIPRSGAVSRVWGARRRRALTRSCRAPTESEQSCADDRAAYCHSVGETIHSPTKLNTLPHYPYNSGLIQWARSNCALKRSVAARPCGSLGAQARHPLSPVIEGYSTQKKERKKERKHRESGAHHLRSPVTVIKLGARYSKSKKEKKTQRTSAEIVPNPPPWPACS